MVLRQGLTWGGAGIALGLPASAIAVRALRGMVYGIAPTDPFTFVVVLLTLLATTLAAAVAPARRAMRVDPMASLKEG